MSEIAVVQHDYEMMWKLSQRVSNTVFVPSALRGKNESVLACIMYGAELGLGPMQSLNSIHVIEGRTAMSPELMRAMVARHGHRIDVVENSNTVCEVKGVRADTGSTATVRWTMEDAKMAGLAGKNNWKTYPRAMLLARATSELCRIVFPDIIAGLSYTPEEVSSIEGIEYDEPIPVSVETFNELADAVIVAADVLEEILDAEIVEETPDPVVVAKRKKVGEKANVVDLTDAIDRTLSKNPTDPSSPPFEFRLRQVESWGGWPYVRAIANVAAKKLGVDQPISAYELAHDEKLYKEVKNAINSKK